MTEMLEKVQELRQDMAQEIEAFTQVCLIKEVQKFQIASLKNLLREHDIQVPPEVQELLDELEKIRNFEEHPSNIFGEVQEDDGGTTFNQETDAARNQRILNAILKRIEKQNNTKNQGTDVQVSLESDSDEDDANKKIEQIVNKKSHSIAHVLISEGFNSLHDNFLSKNLHPYARMQPQIIRQESQESSLNMMSSPY